MPISLPLHWARPVGVALVTAALAPTVRAQSAASRTVDIVAENDLFTLRGRGVPPDYDYTHGTLVGVEWAGASGTLARLVHADASCRSPAARVAGCAMSGVRLAQEIYTPRRDGVVPVAGERPYAGLLSVTGRLERLAPGVTRALELQAGIAGQPSFAETAQMDVHRLVETGPQLGWGHQLAARGVVGVRYSEARRWTHASRGSGFVTGRAQWDAVAGNARSLLSTGASVTIGMRGTGAWSPGTADEAHAPRWFLRVGAREDAVLRDVFIEGWRRGSAAVRRPFVAEGDAATGVHWHRYALEYRQVVRGAEYHAEPSPHPYGSIRLAIDGY